MSRASTSASSMPSPGLSSGVRRPRMWPTRAVARIAEFVIASAPKPRDATKEAASTLAAVQLAMPLILVSKAWKLAAEPKVYAHVGTTSLDSCAKLVRVLFDRVILLDYVKSIDLDLPASSIESIAMLISAAGHVLESLQITLRDEDGPDYTSSYPGHSFGEALRTTTRLKRFTFLSTKPFNLSSLLDVCNPSLKVVDISGLSTTPGKDLIRRQQSPAVTKLVLREPAPDLAALLVHFPHLNHLRMFTEHVTTDHMIRALQQTKYPALRLLEIEAPRQSSWSDRSRAWQTLSTI